MAGIIQAGLEWWLDISIPGHRNWAVIRVNDHGEISVLAIDGRLMLFETLENARLWLRENQYQCYSLQQAADISERLLDQPYLCPPQRGYNSDLLVWMREQVR